MSDQKRRVKTIERRLNMDGLNDTIVIYPPKFANETDEEFQARMNRPLPPGYEPDIIRYGNMTIITPARLRPVPVNQ